MALIQTRRQVIGGIAAATSVGLIGTPAARAAEGALETTTVRLTKYPSICNAPQYVAEELLRQEGFTDIRYVDTPVPGLTAAVSRGSADFTTNYAADLLSKIDVGEAVTLLGGLNIGCF